MKNSAPHSTRRQKGAVLIITLILLIVITLVTVSSVRSTTIDERMAGNARDRNKALQAAEAAVQNCLTMLNAGAYPGTISNPAASTAPPLWDVAANWASSSPLSYAVAMPTAELAADPRCLVETLGGTGNFRVTGRAVGGSDETVVIIQATLSQE